MRIEMHEDGQMIFVDVEEFWAWTRRHFFGAEQYKDYTKRWGKPRVRVKARKSYPSRPKFVVCSEGVTDDLKWKEVVS